MSELKCPFCREPLLACIYNQNDIIYCCDNQDCVYHDDADNPKAKHYLATPEFWQALIDTKKKLDYVITMLERIAVSPETMLEPEKIVPQLAAQALEQINKKDTK